MQHFDNLWKLISVAGAVRDIAQETKTYQFVVEPNITFYLHSELSSLRVIRHDKPEITIQATFQAGFGWRVQAEQDAAGVYLVAKRRMLVGSMSRAQFVATVPHDTFLVLKLERGSLELDDITGEFHIPPRTANRTVVVNQL